MTVREQIQEDMKAAMKARDQVLINTTRGLISEIKRIEIDTRKPVEEDGVVSIVQKEVKKRRDALEFAHKAARNDLIEQNELEIKLLQKYLGEQLSEEKLTELVQKLVADGVDNVGKIMGALSKDYKGKFDGKLANETVKKVLESR